MPEQNHLIRGIDWRQTFPCVNIFRSFRVAFHFSKLLLGLALLLTVYAGGRLLDSVWPSSYRAMAGEIDAYRGISPAGDTPTLDVWRVQQRRMYDDVTAGMLARYGVASPGAATTAGTSQLLTAIDKYRDQQVKDAQDRYAKAVAAAEQAYRAKPDAPGADELREQAINAATKDRDAALAAAAAAAAGDSARVNSLGGIGVFRAFFDYEITQVSTITDAVLPTAWRSVPISAAALAAGIEPLVADSPLAAIYNLIAVGPMWLFWEHPVFCLLFAILFFFAWALFGGAIARIAAVEVALNERIPFRQAMNFAVAKILSFASAPAIPLAFVIILGFVVSALSLIGRISLWGIGPIIVGALFFVALLAGFVLTLVLLGTVGGFNLMFPTIAVEGSDSFDAISRSFNYIYTRPWRMLLYTAVALIYGSATYLFIRGFIWLMLVLTHRFVGIGFASQIAGTQDLFSTMWPNPAVTGQLPYQVDWPSLTAGQSIGAFFMQCWIMLLISFLGAYAISLYFSANTIIYYLMRLEVDATELDEVHQEPADDIDPDDGSAGTTANETTVVITATTAPGMPPETGG